MTTRAVLHCNHCQGPVQPRKPSQTGAHFCPAKECQKAKRKFYYDRKSQEVVNEVMRRRRVFYRAALHDPRVTCPSCGLVDAIDGFPHPGRGGDGACRALRDTPAPASLGYADIALTWPVLRYTDGSEATLRPPTTEEMSA